jgi:hypothetical protein
MLHVQFRDDAFDVVELVVGFLDLVSRLGLLLQGSSLLLDERLGEHVVLVGYLLDSCTHVYLANFLFLGLGHCWDFF